MSYSKFEVKPTFADTQFIKNYLYLFCIDIETEINHKRVYKNYLTPDEQGFTQNILNAYIEAFLKPRTSLDTNTVLKLHSLIAAHLSTPGRFKTGCNKFAVLGRELPKKITCASATEQGLKEFIERWMINTPNPVHVLIISPTNSLDNPNYNGSLVGSMGLFNRDKKLWFSHYSNQGHILERYDHNKHFELLWSAFINPDFVCEVNSMPDEFINPNQVPEWSEYLLKQLTDLYNKKIVLCRFAQDKISCIVELTQGINQLHPFWDGNTRLAVLLLNLLLHTQGLSISLIANPNRLGMFSNAELVQLVIEGQGYFRDLCEGKVPSPYDKWIKEKNYQFQPCAIQSTPAQMQEFIKRVIQCNYQRAYYPLKIYSLPYSSSLFHSPSLLSQKNGILVDDASKPSLHWDNVPDCTEIRFTPELM